MEDFTCMGATKQTRGGCECDVLAGAAAGMLAPGMQGADLFHRSGSPLAPGRGAEPERPGQTPTPSR